MNILDVFTRSPASIQGSQERHRAQLLAALLLILIFNNLLAMASLVLETGGRVNVLTLPGMELQVGLLVCLLLSYGLSRTRLYFLGIWLTIIVIWMWVFSVVILPIDRTQVRGFLAYLVVAVLLSGMLLSYRGVLYVTAATLMALLVLSTVNFGGSIYAMFTACLMALVIVVFVHHRGLLERDGQAKLAESERRYRQLVEHGRDVLFTVSRDGYFTYLTPSAQRLTGYTEAELTGKHYIDLVAPDWREIIRQFYELQLQDSVTELLADFPIITRDGSQKWVEQVTTLMMDGDVIQGMQGMVRDVTERKQAEEALAQERNLLRTVIDNIPDTIYFKDIHSQFALINKAQAQLLGVRFPQDAIGKTDFDFFPAEVAETILTEEKRIAATREPLIDRVEQTTVPDGQSRWLSATKVPVLDHTSQPIGMVGISRDITAWKQFQEVLNLSQGRWRSLVENMPGIVVNVARDGTVLFINRVKTLESIEQTIGTSLYEDVLLPEYREMMRAKIDQVFETGEADEATIHTVYRDGREGTLWYRVQIGPVWDEGKVDSVLLITDDITQRRQAEEALRTSEDRFRTMSEVSPLGIFLTGADGGCLYVNQRSQQIMGIDFESALGNGWLSVVHPEDQEKTFSEWKRVNQAGELFDMIYRFLNHGRVVWVHVKSSPMWDGDHILGYVGTVDDITEHQKAEEALAKERKLMRTLIDNLPAMVFVKDRDGKILLNNTSHAHALGSTPEAVVGKTDFEFFSQEQAEKYAAEDQIVFETGEPLLNLEELSYDAFGQKNWKSTIKVPLRNSQGDVIAVVGVTRDITEDRLAKEVLAKERNLLRTVIDNVPNFIYVKDTESRYLLNNAAHARSVGRMPADILGKSDFDLFPPELAEKYHADEQQIITSGIPLVDREEVSFGEHQEKIVASTTKVPLRDSDGQIIGLVGITRDITEHRNFENAMKQARDQALEASRLKSEFLATMSHEIRTPMNGIMGMTELLMSTALDEEQQDYAGIVLNEAKSLLTIINDILDFSKIEAGKMVLENIDFDVQDTVNRVATFLNPKAAEKGLNLLTEIEADVPKTLRGDSGRVRQILLNLVGNAVKFTRRGEVRVQVAVEAHDAEYTLLRFAVTDTGIGLSEVARKRLFQPFTQADGSTTRQYGGTGLGLVISMRLAELMNGKIGVESEEGVGSTFWFTARFENTAQSLMIGSDEDDEPSNGVAHPDCLVLIAEDNPVNQSLALKQLRKLGYRARLVGNGVEALDEIISYPGQYALVLMDCHMPVMDGYEATRLIRQNEATTGSHTPIIALTASTMEGDRERCLVAGMDDFLSKPVSLEILREALERWSE